MGYRHWPPDPSEPPPHDPDPWTTGAHAHGESSGRHGAQESGPGQHRRHGGYAYGTDPDATYVYPAVPPEPSPRSQRRTEPDHGPADDDGDNPAQMPALAWTAGLFVVPVLLYLLWAATRAGAAAPGCVDAGGAPCDPPRAEALAGLASVLPGLAGALTLALLATLGLRRIAVNWRSGTVAFAASVIGAGTATLIAGLLN